MASTPSDVGAPILPEQVLAFAWGLTIDQSGTEDKISTKARADEIRNKLSDIRNKAYATLTDLKKGNAPRDKIKKADQNVRYVENVLAAIDSCERSLVSITRGRDLNFQQADKVMEIQLQNAASADRLTPDLHSAIPRAFATGGSAAGTVFVNYVLSFFHVSIPSEVLYAAAVILAGVGYWFYQWKIAPINKRRAQIEYIKNDYQRDLYFHQYVESVRSVSNALFDQTLDIYQTVYGKPYFEEKYNEKGREKAVSDALAGKLGLSNEFCDYAHLHYYAKPRRRLLWREPIITPERWATCETSVGCRYCREYKKEKQKPHKEEEEELKAEEKDLKKKTALKAQQAPMETPLNKDE